MDRCTLITAEGVDIQEWLRQHTHGTHQFIIHLFQKTTNY